MLELLAGSPVCSNGMSLHTGRRGQTSQAASATKRRKRLREKREQEQVLLASQSAAVSKERVQVWSGSKQARSKEWNVTVMQKIVGVLKAWGELE